MISMIQLSYYTTALIRVSNDINDINDINDVNDNNTIYFIRLTVSKNVFSKKK